MKYGIFDPEHFTEEELLQFLKESKTMAEFLQKVINGEHCVTSFAGQCGIKTRMMHKYLNGEVTPSLESALLIAAALNMGSHWIWFVNLIDPRLRIILVETSRGKTIPDIDEKLVEKHLKGID